MLKIRYILHVVKGRNIPGTIFLALFAFIASGASLGLASSCSRGYGKSMTLPPDPEFSSDIGWAVVVSSYAKLMRAPARDSGEIDLARIGTVFEIRERRIDAAGSDRGGFWYRIGDALYSGWIHGSDLAVYPSEYQARKAAGASDTSRQE